MIIKKKAKKKSRSWRSSPKLLVSLSLLAALGQGTQRAFGQTVSCFQSLNFGSIMACSSPGTITINPSTGGSTVGGVCLSGMGTTFQGRCQITGSFFPTRPMNISVSSSGSISNGAQSMSVDTFNINSPGNGTSTTITAFITVIDIGARLNVGANQADGTYVGTVTVTANFI